MFRATLLLVVSVLSVGQEARLLCQLWCHPADAMETACHHQAGSRELPRLQTSVRCDETPVAAAFLREEVKRDVERFTSVVFVVFRHHVTPDMIDAGSDLAPAHPARSSLELRPLITALRI